MANKIFDCSMQVKNNGYTVIPGKDTSNLEMGGLEEFNPSVENNFQNTWLLAGCPKTDKQDFTVGVSEVYAKCAWLSPVMQPSNPFFSRDKLYTTGFDNINSIQESLMYKSLGNRFVLSGEIPFASGQPQMDFCQAILGTSCSGYDNNRFKKSFGYYYYYQDANHINNAGEKRTESLSNFNYVCVKGDFLGNDSPDVQWQIPSYPMAYMLTGGDKNACNAENNKDYLNHNNKCSDVSGFYATFLPAGFINYDTNAARSIWTSSYSADLKSWAFDGKGALMEIPSNTELSARCVAIWPVF